MKAQDVTVSIDRFNCYGDVEQAGVFLHFGESVTVRVSDDVWGFFDFTSRIRIIEREVELVLGTGLEGGK